MTPFTRALLAGALMLPAAVHADEPGPGGSKPTMAVTGEQVYRTVCQACHMVDGKGATGAGTIPALAGDPNLAAAGYPLTIVIGGHGAMPWMRGALTPAQMANVVNYVRTHFGNHYTDAVTETDVKQLLPPPDRAPGEH